MAGDDESFDIAPTVPVAPVKKAPANLLTRDKVKMVGFHKAVKGNGYVYSQVDTFVELVEISFEYLEGELHNKNMELYHAQEENNDLQERSSVLQATIEIFRANGDPIRTDDGNYLTESQIDSTSTDARDREILALRAERDALIEALARAREEGEAGWVAEADLRKYLEEIQPWIQALEKSESVEPAARVESDQPKAPVREGKVATDIEAPLDTFKVPEASSTFIPETSVASPPRVESLPIAPTFIEPVRVQSVPLAPTTLFGQNKTSSEDDGWDDEIITERPVVFPPAPVVKPAFPTVAPSVQVQVETPKSKKRRKDILLSAPEAAHLLSDGAEEITLIGEDDPLEAAPVSPNGTPFLATAPEVTSLD